MSDFLSRLAERTLGVAPVMEPALPGVFGLLEPRNPEEESLEDFVVVRGEQQEPPRERVREVRPAAPPNAASTRETSGATTSATEAETPLAPPPAAEPVAPPPLIVRTASPSSDSAPVGPPHDPRWEQPSETDATGLPRTLQRDEAARPISAARAEQAPVEQRAPLAPPSFPALVPVTASVQPTFETREPLVAPAVNAPEPAPPVRITIGRVEVRALPPAPPAERPRRRAPEEPPRQSLSEYLRRGGGAR